MKRIITLVLLIATYVVSAQTTGTKLPAKLNTDDPLWVVNNVLLTDKKVSDIVVKALEAEKTESIDVLKGAAATTKFGTQANNGAVVVTLKEQKSDPNAQLVVANDVVFTYQPLGQLFMKNVNPNDIETMSLLKGEPAKANTVTKLRMGLLLLL